MNIAVAVGLITAGSTIIGGLTASITTLKAQGNQVKLQRTLAETEHKEQQEAASRAIRRDAYVALLNKFDEVEVLITECWKQIPSIAPHVQPPHESDVLLEKGLKSFDTTMNMVRLEGPTTVVVAAANARQVFWTEMIFVSRLSIDNKGSREILHRIDAVNYNKCVELRLMAKNQLVHAALNALNDPHPQYQSQEQTSIDKHKSDAAPAGTPDSEPAI
jgi:hypothetical protein